MSERKTYTIAGKTFYQEELVFGQEVWLRDHVFRKPGVLSMSWLQLMAEHGMTFLAIILIEEGTTQADKVLKGWGAACALKEWLNAYLHPREILEYRDDFFVVNTGPNLWLLAEAIMPMQNETGSPIASSSLQMVT